MPSLRFYIRQNELYTQNKRVLKFLAFFVFFLQLLFYLLQVQIFYNLLIDFGLNLVSGENGYKVNPVQADILAKDLTQVGINLTNPKLVPYSILRCQADPNSPSGLVFKLSEEGKDRAKEPIKLTKEEKDKTAGAILNTNDFNWSFSPSVNGLFRAYLNRNGNWNANDDNLANSNDNGRIAQEWLGLHYGK